MDLTNLPPTDVDVSNVDRSVPYQPPVKADVFNEICIVGEDNAVGDAATVMFRHFGIRDFSHPLKCGKLNILGFATAKKLTAGDWNTIFFILKNNNIKTRRFTRAYVKAQANVRNGRKDTRVLDINKEAAAADNEGSESPVL